MHPSNKPNPTEAPKNKRNQVNVSFSKEQRDSLAALADSKGLTVNQLIRRLMLDEAARLGF